MKYPHSLAVIASLTLAFGSAPGATTSTWLPTAAGTTYNWNTATNWDTNPVFPNAAGDVANVNNDIVGNQTIRLQQLITVGTLNLGDPNGSNTFNISTGTLVFDSGVSGVAAQLNLASVVVASNTISSPLVTLNSDLNWTTGAQGIATSGSVNIGSHNVNISGGTLNNATWTISGDLVGTGTITYSGAGGISIGGAGPKSFSGVLVLNGGRTGSSNAGSLTTNSTTSLVNASNVILNGAFSGNAANELGATWNVGNNSPSALPAVQRITSNTLTLNGGSLLNKGQNISGGVGTTTDTIATTRANSGMSVISVTAWAASTGNEMTSTSLTRSAGATIVAKSDSWGGRSKWYIGNASSYLIGGSGGDGTKNMSIFSWVVGNGNGGNDPTDFMTYTSTGVRNLASTEYNTFTAAAVDDNVSTGAFTGMGATKTINSLKLTATASQSLSGGTLSITSGAVLMTGNNGGISSGTIDFGSREGLIYTNATNTNRMDAVIAGSGGLTKSSTGTLILAANNTYTGLTYVGSGTLQVGDGVNASHLGVTGDVKVANGATLSLMNGLAIADNAVLTLENFGSFNGMVSIATGVNESIGGLWLGDTFYNGLGLYHTFGAVGSGADFQSNQWFAGAGILTVVPEPSSLALLGLGAALALSRRRRK